MTLHNSPKIVEFKNKLDLAVEAMKIADPLTISADPIRKALAEAELNTAALRAERAIVWLLTTKPRNASERVGFHLGISPGCRRRHSPCLQRLGRRKRKGSHHCTRQSSSWSLPLLSAGPLFGFPQECRGLCVFDFLPCHRELRIHHKMRHSRL